MKKYISNLLMAIFMLGCTFIYGTNHITLFASDGETTTTHSDCIFGSDCTLCDELCADGSCICWLVLLLLIILCIVLIGFIILITLKIMNMKQENAKETSDYVNTYNQMKDNRQREIDLEEQIEGKALGLPGFEDIQIRLEKDIDDKGLKPVSLDFVSKETGNEDVSLQFQEPKQKPENQGLQDTIEKLILNGLKDEDDSDSLDNSNNQENIFEDNKEIVAYNDYPNEEFQMNAEVDMEEVKEYKSKRFDLFNCFESGDSEQNEEVSDFTYTLKVDKKNSKKASTIEADVIEEEDSQTEAFESGDETQSDNPFGDQ